MIVSSFRLLWTNIDKKTGKSTKSVKSPFGPGLGRLPQVGVWLAARMECPTLVGMGVGWPPTGPLGSGSLKNPSFGKRVFLIKFIYFFLAHLLL